MYLQSGQLERRVGHLRVVAHQARVALQVVPAEVDQVAEAAVDVGVGVVGQDGVLLAQEVYCFLEPSDDL